MKIFEEELSRINERSRHEVIEKLNDISSRLGDCEDKLKSLSEKLDAHIDVNSSIIESVFTSIFTLESKLRESKINKDGGEDGGEDGDDSLGAHLMKNISDGRMPYVLEKVREIIEIDSDTKREEKIKKLMFSGDVNNEEFALVSSFIHYSGILTEKGMEERDKILKKIDRPGFDIS